MMALEQRIASQPDGNELCMREQEARRAAALRKKGEAEFEARFLRGPISPTDNSVVTTPAAADDDDGCFFPLADVACLLPSEAEVTVQLPSRPFSLRPIADVNASCTDMDDGCDGNDDDDGADGGTSISGCNVDDGHDDAASRAESEPPTAASLVPQPTPLPPRRLQAVEIFLPVEEALTTTTTVAAAVSTTPTATTTATNTTSATSCGSVDAPGLERHHEQFLRNLKALQEKLARAAGNADVNNTIESSACHANVSVSSMSSGFTPSRRPTDEGAQEEEEEEEETGTSEVDTSGSSGTTSLSSVYSRPYPTMTAEQLRAALLRMKMRMRSA
ncbi:hypothetical protein DQ04_08301040 [Trypanosoma grayi]|uniref:hypothetical protein n=1 Tax=Trypanosoma grayi TaxID=71804 RepID=UPI0004F462BA|nr:hypothetical protein DQ04_08301040 [Trypanosoma grayi]KEG07987.1 hypothetical protein DQ04_08301040 [Trypanosoma grayi]